MAAALIEIPKLVIEVCRVNAFQFVLGDNLRDADDGEVEKRVERKRRINFTRKVTAVVFLDSLSDKSVLRLCHNAFRAFPYLQDKILEEVDFLDVYLFLGNLKRVHGDGFFLGIGNVLAAEILA